MKLVRLFLTVVIIVIALICNSTKVEAGDFLGEYCWQTVEGNLIKLAVTKTGSDSFLVNGSFSGQDGSIEPLCGSGVASGNKIYMIVNSAGEKGSESYVYINRIVLDGATLNGTGEGMGMAHDKNNLDPDHMDLDYCDESVLTFVSCP